MKHKLSLTLGIILLLIICLATSPAKAKSPTMESILEAIAALQTSVNNQSTAIGTLQTSVNNQSTAIGTLQTSVDNLESFQGNMPPAWYQILPSAERFLSVMGGDAVLDRETGLVWEKEPSKFPAWWLDVDKHASWFDAFNHCTTLLIGSRHGWRLPMIQELASLVDATKELPALPAGHPFIGDFINNYYWSAYNDAYNIKNAWAVNFGYPGYLFYADKESRFNVWCVRGGQGVNPVPNSGGPLP